VDQFVAAISHMRNKDSTLEIDITRRYFVVVGCSRHAALRTAKITSHCRPGNLPQVMPMKVTHPQPAVGKVRN
jgi:hypothetical protein